MKAALLLAVVFFMASCGNKKSQSDTAKPASEKISETAVYQCSMKCEGEKTYDKAGQCPVCNMDLEKTESVHEHTEGDNHESH